MSKRKDIEEVVNLLVVALRHKIGAAVDPTAPYAKKYLVEAEASVSKTKEKVATIHLNAKDKKELEEKIRRKLQRELEQRTYIDNEKFSLMKQEIANVLKSLNLV